MKLLILVLSHKDNGGTYSNFFETQKKTWDSINVENIETYYYFGESSDNVIIGDEIHTTDVETPKCTEKMITTFDLIKNFNFDYLVRTNSSSYLDKKMIYNFLLDKPRSGYYGGIIGNHNGISFASGALFTMSRDVFNIVVDNLDKINCDLIDDVSVGDLLRNFNIFPTNVGFSRLDVVDVNETYNPIIDDFYHFRFKKNIHSRECDIDNMFKIHNLKIKNTH